MNNAIVPGLGPLPPWFERPRARFNNQRALFPDPLPEVLAALSVSNDELTRWHASGWVSFGSDRLEPLGQADVDEIRFVRDVVRSGLSDAYILRLFAQLPRPMNFNPDAVAYSFSLGWVEAPAPEAPKPDPSEIVDEYVDEWLEDLARDEDESRLADLRDRIHQLLTALHASGSEEKE